MKSKYLALGLSLALMLGMAACGGQQAQQEPDQGQVQQSEPISTTPPVESMEAKNETDTAIPLAELDVVAPEEAGGVGTVEGAESVEVELFTEVNETVYATGTVNIRASYMADSDKLGSLSAGESVTRTGVAIEGTEAEGGAEYNYQTVQLLTSATVISAPRSQFNRVPKALLKANQRVKPSNSRKVAALLSPAQPSLVVVETVKQR